MLVEITCKGCQKRTTKELTQEDIDDGCKDGTLYCDECIDGIAEIAFERLNNTH